MERRRILKREGVFLGERAVEASIEKELALNMARVRPFTRLAHPVSVCRMKAYTPPSAIEVESSSSIRGDVERPADLLKRAWPPSLELGRLPGLDPGNLIC